jgi:hypothetical protein
MEKDLRQGKQVDDYSRLEAFVHVAESGGIQTLVPFLPLLLNLDGRPFSLDDHYQF